MVVRVTYQCYNLKLKISLIMPKLNVPACHAVENGWMDEQNEGGEIGMD